MNDIQELLKSNGVEFSTGLSVSELKEIELKFHINFPPDLKSFLMIGLPISEKFPNWRGALSSKNIENEIRSSLLWPLEGIIFDIVHNDFWFDKWGKKPDSDFEAEKIIKNQFHTLPTLIPIYSHRYIPMTPIEFDNPVFSVYQTDVIYYGLNLIDYLANEFKFAIPSSQDIPKNPKQIYFWSNLAEDGWDFDFNKPLPASSIIK